MRVADFVVVLREKGGSIWAVRQDWHPEIYNLVAEAADVFFLWRENGCGIMMSSSEVEE